MGLEASDYSDVPVVAALAHTRANTIVQLHLRCIRRNHKK